MTHAELRLLLLTLAMLAFPVHGVALESDRQQPLLVDADSSDGTLGDGKSTLRGHVEIRQGTLLVKAEQAEVEKFEGRVREVLLTGNPVLLQQEIENQGLVSATARTISYQVATGIVTLSGEADVDHPQYQVSGEILVYDMNKQHFQGSGGDNNGRIRIQLEPEMIPDDKNSKPDRKQPSDGGPDTPVNPEQEQEQEQSSNASS